MTISALKSSVSLVLEGLALLRQRLRVFLLTLVSPSGLLCALYYTLLSNAFRREQRAVVQGILRNAKGADEDALIFKLRRNIHRVEKGLMIKPRKPVFALSYIGGAVDTFVRLLDCGVSNNGKELNWAKDVLHSYFEAVSSHPVIDKAKAKFEYSLKTTQKIIFKEGLYRIPYTRANDLPVCDFETFSKLCVKRRSIRWFQKKLVPRDLIDKALETALQAPSACNRQPFLFRFFDDPGKVQAVASLPMGTTGFADNIPVICALCGDLTAYSNERDRHIIYVDASLAAMNFMLALETLGLSSCALNWPDMETREKRIASLLNLKPEQRVIMLMAVGYADAGCPVAYSQKKTLEQIRTFNE